MVGQISGSLIQRAVPQRCSSVAELQDPVVAWPHQRKLVRFHLVLAQIVVYQLSWSAVLAAASPVGAPGMCRAFWVGGLGRAGRCFWPNQRAGGAVCFS